MVVDDAEVVGVAVTLALGVLAAVDDAEVVCVAVTLAVGVLVLVDVTLALREGVCERVLVGVDVVVGSATHQDRPATASAVAMVPLLAADTEMERRCAPLAGST